MQVQGSRCIFYKRTADGDRCVLMPPEDWRQVKQRYLQYCLNQGKGCPVYERVASLMGPSG